MPLAVCLMLYWLLWWGNVMVPHFCILHNNILKGFHWWAFSGCVGKLFQSKWFNSHLNFFLLMPLAKFTFVLFSVFQYKLIEKHNCEYCGNLNSNQIWKPHFIYHKKYAFHFGHNTNSCTEAIMERYKVIQMTWIIFKIYPNPSNYFDFL